MIDIKDCQALDVIDQPKELLDCTLRDGGYINNWKFSDQEVLSCYEAISISGIDYCEIGFKSTPQPGDDKGKWWYSKEVDINKIYNDYQGSTRCKIAVMINAATDTLKEFRPKCSSKIDLVRVLVGHNNPDESRIIDYKQSAKCIQLTEDLLELGYEVAVNIACIDKVPNSKLDILLTKLKGLPLKCIYIADTYGVLNEDSVSRHIKRIAKYGFRVGVHTHNNHNDALAKSKIALNCQEVSIVDACIGGLGRGAGNCNSELLLLFLSKKFPNLYNAEPVMLHYEKYIRNSNEYSTNSFCYGYHPLYAYTAHCGIHPNFADELIKATSLEMPQKLKILRHIGVYCYSTNKYSYNKKLVSQLRDITHVDRKIIEGLT